MTSQIHWLYIQKIFKLIMSFPILQEYQLKFPQLAAKLAELPHLYAKK